MRIVLLLSLVIGLQFLAHGQAPVNDDCDGIIDLGVAPYCPDVTLPGNEADIFDNIDATATDIGFGNNPTCFNGGTAQRDVWFAFTTSDTIIDYTITVMGVGGPNGEPAIRNPQVALYRGACVTNNLAELLCASAAPGETMVELDAEGLTPNITYYIRINDYSGSGTPNAGSFKLCIDKKDPVSLITEGSSTACAGILYDSGGPDGDYSNNENHTFTICPNQPNQCINFGLTYYDIEDGGFFGVADQLLFFDGPTANPATLITAIGGFDFIQATSGVCLEVQASSGCLTVQFVSDGFAAFSGFEGRWECQTTPCTPYTPISVNTTVTDEDILNALSGPQTQAVITNIDCTDGAYATFAAGDNSDLGIGRGLLLTTGQASYAVGPNTSAGDGNIFDADLEAPGDVDLDILSLQAGNETLSEDACVIELDVFANTNELIFEYVFASEEYPEFINQDFNDIFAFLISGPDIMGNPAIGNQQNIAILPNTNTPVEINSVNHTANWEYFRTNEIGTSLQYDGMTSDFLGVKKSLSARANVTPCQTYHLKLAIADRGDGLYDSGVFISDLRSGTPRLEIVFNSGIDYLLEGCIDAPDEIIIRLDNPQEEALTFNVTISGSAILGEDYLLELPATITFQPGVNEFRFPVSVLTDLDDSEGTENILISLTNDYGCGIVLLDQLNIEIRDQFVVEINAGRDTIFVCQGAAAPLSVEGAAEYFWTPLNLFDNPFSNMPTVSTDVSQWVFVEGRVGAECVARDSIFLQILDPQLAIAPDTVNICRGQSVALEASNNTLDQGLVWTPNVAISATDTSVVTVSPVVNTLYTATITLGEGCAVSDSVFVSVDFLNIPTLAADTLICQNYGVTLAALVDVDTSGTTYSWTPVAGLDNPTSPTPLAFPAATTTYQLISTTNNGACADTSSMTITVLPADVSILSAQDTILLCLGESVQLEATTSTGNTNNFTWLPNDGSLSATNALSVTATPNVNTWYFTNLTVGACFVMDSVYVQVDSLPTQMGIMADPMEDSYCEGELVVLSSPVYDPALYPNLTHAWVGPGQETSDTLYNMVLRVVDTFTYVRTTINGGCIQDDEITLNVIRIDGADITPVAPICPGESVQLTIADPMLEAEFTWSPAQTLSCDDCPNPIATPEGTTTYMLEAEVDGCTAERSVTVTVIPLPTLNAVADQTICAGTGVALNPAGAQPNATYVWTALGFSSSEPNPTVTPTTTTSYVGVATNECGSTTDAVTLTLIAPGRLLGITSPDTITICGGQTFAVSADVENSTNGTNSLVWFYDGESELGATANFTATQSGYATFVYQYGISANQDCEDLRDSVFIQVNAPVEGMVSQNTTICQVDAAPLTISNIQPQAGVTYAWTSSTDPNFTATTPGLTVTPTVTTTYTLVSTSAVCGENSQSVTVTVIVPGQFNGITNATDPLTVCRGEEVALAANVVNSPNAPVQSLDWTYGGAAQTGTSATFVAANSGTVQLVYVYGYDGVVCETFTDDLQLIVNDAPAISTIADTTLCVADIAAIMLSDISAQPGVIYSWSSSTDPAFTSNDPNVEVAPTTTTTYTLTAALGDCTSTESVTITVQQPATLEAGPDQAYEEGAAGVTVTAAFTNATEGELSWRFEGSNVGTGGSAMISSAILELVIDSLPRYAYVTLTTACETLVDSVQIVLQGVKIPNIFSPNGDETNDVFRPFFATDVEALDVKVYNRWGRLVYESNDTANTGWDGKVDGKDAPSDVYIYSISYTLRGAAKSETGEVTLVR